MRQPPARSREQAQRRFASYCRAARLGTFGPAGFLGACTLADTLEVAGVELGDYDREVIGRLGALLTPLDCAVVNSLLERAARD